MSDLIDAVYRDRISEAGLRVRLNILGRAIEVVIAIMTIPAAIWSHIKRPFLVTK
jgi:hypothetical protein